MTDKRFPPSRRLKRQDDFDRGFERKCSAADRRLVIYGCENGLAHSRLGLSVSRKVGNAAARNRWKRLLREAFRLNQDRLPVGLDLIVIPRSREAPELRSLAESLVILGAEIARRLRKEVRL